MSACLAIVLGAAAAAGYPAPHGLDHLRITGGEFRQDVKKLDLSDKQLARAKAIHTDYATEFADALEAFKGARLWVAAILPAMYDAGDRELDRLNYADRHSLQRLWQESARRLEWRYFSDLGDLTEVPPQRVEALRRARLRRRILAAIGDAYNSPSGADLDVIKLVEETATGGLLDPEIARQLAAYAAALDPLLARVDRLLWRRSDDNRQTIDALREAVRGGSDPDIASSHDAIVATRLRLPILCNRIRAINERAVDALAAQLPDETAGAVREKASRTLYPFLYASQEEQTPQPDDLLRITLKRADLDRKKRASLLAIRSQLADARRRAVSHIDGLYERTISRQRYRDEYEIWARHLERLFRGAEIMEYDDPTEADRRAFEEAVERWHRKLASFHEQIRSIVAADGATGQ